jgi:basic membrane protein A and related proteins
MRFPVLSLVALALIVSCKRDGAASGPKIGIVTDVGGRGDQSFNDGALRGLELWSGGFDYTTSGYKPAPPEEIAESIPAELRSAGISPLGVTPVVLQSKAQEDYEPNLQTLVDAQAQLVVGVGFMLQPAVQAVARKNPGAKFLLIDSPIVDTQGKPYVLPNVRSVTFRENEGSFLIGAIAAQVTKSGTVAFVGGIEIPLIKKFEAGFRSGVDYVRPDAKVLIAYTNSFDKAQAGKQVAQDLIAKGADVVFHAAGADGLGAIAAAKAAGKWAIGVDSDQNHVAPETVITSMVKRVDYAVWLTTRDVIKGAFTAGESSLGLKEGGVGYAPLRGNFGDAAAIATKVETIRADIVAGKIKVPATIDELNAYMVAAHR